MGDALSASKIPREELIISSKFHIDTLYANKYYRGKRKIFNIRNFKSIRDTVEESLIKLNIDYLDILFIHWPWDKYQNIYKEIIKLYQDDLIKSIGVCHFTQGHLESLKSISNVMPVINQIEISPLNTQKGLIKYCQDNGIMVEAVSTFSHFQSSKPRLEIINNEILNRIAESHHKSTVQVVLRWLIQQNIVVIPKSSNSDHIKENIDIFDFSLDMEEMALIDSLNEGRCLNYNPYAPHIIKNIPRQFRHYSNLM